MHYKRIRYLVYFYNCFILIFDDIRLFYLQKKNSKHPEACIGCGSECSLDDGPRSHTSCKLLTWSLQCAWRDGQHTLLQYAGSRARLAELGQPLAQRHPQRVSRVVDVGRHVLRLGALLRLGLQPDVRRERVV